MIQPRVPKPLVLCILDGWGIAPDSPGNAISRANPVNFNTYWRSFPHILLKTSGSSAGLPEGTVGNSEVGHLNLGAGRIVYQDVLRIDLSISDASFFQNSGLKNAINHALHNNSKIHLMGLIGTGSVHSKMSHLLEILKFIKKCQIPEDRVKIHVFTDGRDSSPTIGKSVVENLENRLRQDKLGQIASISGRYFAMDRDNHWERTEKAYLVLTQPSGKTAKSTSEAIVDSYSNGIMDEFIEPVQIVNTDGRPQGLIEDNDSVIFFNFRPDRARQLTKAFVLKDLEGMKTSSNKDVHVFVRKTKLNNIFFATMTEYEQELPASAVLFPAKEVAMPLARVLSERGIKQVHIAETEKYAHVTYFFNGWRETPFLGEDRILVDSKRVSTYDLAPEMSAQTITQKAISRINSKIFDFLVVNFANADMVGHTGNFGATIKAVQIVDDCLGKLYRTVTAVGGILVITADHGNAEVMINASTGEVDTEHNANPAPLIIAAPRYRNQSARLHTGILADVAPTILATMKIPKPSQMIGKNLLQ